MAMVKATRQGEGAGCQALEGRQHTRLNLACLVTASVIALQPFPAQAAPLTLP